MAQRNAPSLERGAGTANERDGNTNVVDPGHGGADVGAVGPRGVREADVALAIARRVVHRLHAATPSLAVVMTRNSDLEVDLGSRSKTSNEASADLFVSIHANASRCRKPCGFEVWTSPGATRADYAAICVFDLVSEILPGLRGRVDYSDSDPDKEAKFWVLVHTSSPAILVETAFISNPREEALLN